MNGNAETLTLSRNPPQGALAVVIFEPIGQFAYKLFKSPRHPGNRDDPMSECRIRDYFRSELDAYAIVSASPQLARHVARFYGVPPVRAVIEEDGEDKSEHFLLDCCLKLERLQGQDEKLGNLRERFPHLEEFGGQLQQAGVNHVRDSSVFNPDDPERFKLIDIATFDWGAVPE
jgi:hypothetical protein